MHEAVVEGIKVWLDDDTQEVMYPECVGCGSYFNEDPCEECGLEEA